MSLLFSFLLNFGAALNVSAYVIKDGDADVLRTSYRESYRNVRHI